MKNENEYQVFEELLRCYRNGDSDAAGEIILKVDPMIKKRCRHYFGFENEDLMQEGRLRCFELIVAYNMDFVDVRFLGYLKQMLSYFFGDLKKRQKNILDNEFLSTYGDAADCELSLIEDERAALTYTAIELEEIMSILDDSERDIIMENIMHGKKLVEVSWEKNLNYEKARIIKRRALEKLKEMLQKDFD
ncbi:MAG: sigma-70 family RNA polymerase sigma factor [Proteocatella sp.]